MFKKMFFWVSTLYFVFTTISHSNTSKQVSPLGLPIGKVSYETVKKQFDSKILLRELGTNSYTGGKVLESEAPEFLGVKGLRGLRFIFDANNNLSAVLMKLDKSGEKVEDGHYAGFLNVFSMLQNKYDLLSKDLNPRKNNMTAQFRGTDGVYIQMYAPKNDSIFELRYLSNDFIVKREQVLQAQNQDIGFMSSDNQIASQNIY